MTKETKKCGKCGEVKGLECFSKDKSRRDGLQCYCKVCVGEYDRKRYQENPECKKEQSRKWWENNLERGRGNSRKWQKANPERKKEGDRKWREENPERVKENNRKWVKANPERVKKNKRKWEKENPDKLRAKGAKRRAMELNATPKWLTEEQDLQIKLIYKEARVLEEADGIKRHVDHIVPLQGKNVCGLHVPWNLQVITAKQNLSKSNKH
jgi:hypothetical protein